MLLVGGRLTNRGHSPGGEAILPRMDLRADIEALVDVGRRAPGSDAERRAAAYLKQRLEGLGREVEVESVDVWPAWPLAYAILAAVAVVGSVLSVSVPALGAALALVATLLTFLDAGVLLPTLRRLLGRGPRRQRARQEGGGAARRRRGPRPPSHRSARAAPVGRARRPRLLR